MRKGALAGEALVNFVVSLLIIGIIVLFYLLFSNFEVTRNEFLDDNTKKSSTIEVYSFLRAEIDGEQLIDKIARAHYSKNYNGLETFAIENAGFIINFPDGAAVKLGDCYAGNGISVLVPLGDKQAATVEKCSSTDDIFNKPFWGVR